MAMVVKNNLSAKNTLNQLDKNEKAKNKNLKNLSSGLKINSAGDDASGLSISERMEVPIRTTRTRRTVSACSRRQKARSLRPSTSSAR